MTQRAHAVLTCRSSLLHHVQGMWITSWTGIIKIAFILHTRTRLRQAVALYSREWPNSAQWSEMWWTPGQRRGKSIPQCLIHFSSQVNRVKISSVTTSYPDISVWFKWVDLVHGSADIRECRRHIGWVCNCCMLLPCSRVNSDVVDTWFWPTG